MTQNERKAVELAPEPVEPRARLVSAQIQFEIVMDDGETLEPVPLQPINIPARAWPPDVDQVLAQVEREVAKDQG